MLVSFCIKECRADIAFSVYYSAETFWLHERIWVVPTQTDEWCGLGIDVRVRVRSSSRSIGDGSETNRKRKGQAR